MPNCDVCGRHVDMPYDCRHCGSTHCSEHRLPENHGCPGLDNWNDPDGVFDSGFDASVADPGRTSDSSLLGGLGLRTGAGSVLSYFRGNVSYLFLAIMGVVFVVQLFVGLRYGFDSTLFRSLFVLSTTHPLYVWTWVTSVFSHASFTHIAGNAIILFFFGPVLEQRIGSNRFTGLFLISGVLAGLGQIGLGFLLGNTVGVLGASGAILAILGAITVLNPDLKVYLYFILPIPIWLLTAGYAVLSVVGVVAQGAIGGNIAHAAHLVGLVIGLAYGQRIKGEVRGPPGQLQFGRGGRGPGGPGRGGPGGRL